MPKSLTGIQEHSEDIASVRSKTRAARFKPLPQGVETVDEVVDAALGFLEDRLGPASRFKVARSQRGLNRKAHDLTQSIQLRLSSGNLSGVSVEVSASALVRSSKFKAWCESHGTGYPRDLLWIRQIGYLGGKNAYFKWQLADKAVREEELLDLHETICALALPALDAWATKEALATAVFRRTEVERVDWLMEIALWAGAPAAAADLLAQHLAASPEVLGHYRTERARFIANASARPLPEATSGAAYLVVRHGLTVLA